MILGIIKRQMEGQGREMWVSKKWKPYLFLCQRGSSRISLCKGDNELNLGRMEHLTVAGSLTMFTDLGSL